MKPAVREVFQSGSVPHSVAASLLQSVYAMYCDDFDIDAPERAAIEQKTNELLTEFQQHRAAVACYPLTAYVDKHFRRQGFSRKGLS